MFSAVREGTSPPQKRTRTLDIADISCLFATKQRAAFLSPERQTTKSRHTRPSPPSSKTLPVTEEIDVFSQELIEEDSIIQSSLPQYLNHVFGDSIINGGSSNESKTLSTTYTSINCSSTSASTCMSVRDNHIPASSTTSIQESQGFTVVNVNTAETDHSTGNTLLIKNESKTDDGNMELSPLLFNSPSSLPIPSNNSSSHLQEHDSKSSLKQNVHEKSTVVPASTPCLSCEKLTHSPLPALSSMSLVTKDTANNKATKRKRKLSGTRPTSTKKTKYICPPSCSSLNDCVHMKTESLVTIIAIVLQVNSVMEVTCKKGSLAGSTVPVSSLLLADPTKSCLKLLLWREAACWVERIIAGDIVYFKSIRLKRWQGEVVGHTIMYSKVLNLHQPKKGLPPKFLKMVPAESLQGLQEWGKERHGYLFRDGQPLPTSQRPVHFKTSDDIGLDSVIHFRAKLVAIISERVVLLSDQPGREVILYLLLSSSMGGVWYRELREGVGQVWEIQYLAVTLEGTQSTHSLQVTSRSQLRMLSMDSRDAQTILQKFHSSSHDDYITLVDSISSLLACKTSGIRRFKAKTATLNFQLLDGNVLSLRSLCLLDGLELVSKLLQAVYVGCEACAKPLTQDMNHVYTPCQDCMSKRPGGHLTSAFCYRPLIMCLCDESATLEVVTNQVAVIKLLGGVKAAELVHMNLAQNKSQGDVLREAIELLLSSDDSQWWTVNVVFAVDDFSFVESLTASLVDWTKT